MPSLIYTWESLRDEKNNDQLIELISQSSFINQQVVTIVHIRTAHYAVFKVSTVRDSYVVRIGIANDQLYMPSNNGFLDTATNVMHDQMFEFEMGQYIHSNTDSVICPIYYERIHAGVDLMWLPFIADDGNAISTQKWFDVLSSFHDIERVAKLPVFNNRQKTMNRLKALPAETSKIIAAQYDELLDDLFRCATRWGVVHGDVHRDNAINVTDRTFLYDLDTVSWGPQVWDITHLAYRYGKNGNTGYSIDSLRQMLGYSEEEFEVAVRLRSLASEVARLYNDI